MGPGIDDRLQWQEDDYIPGRTMGGPGSQGLTDMERLQTEALREAWRLAPL